MKSVPVDFQNVSCKSHMHFNTSVCLVVCFCGCVSTSQWAYLKKKEKHLETKQLLKQEEEQKKILKKCIWEENNSPSPLRKGIIHECRPGEKYFTVDFFKGN